MGVEIERKFLVDRTAFEAMKHTASTVSEIIQGYLAKKPCTVRVRYGKSWQKNWPEPHHFSYITVKSKTVGITRDEFEYDVPFYDAVDMMKLCPSSLEKTRYLFRHTDGHVWSVDEFKGLNEGLLLAEIELTREDEAFDIPTWAIADVTDDERFFNSYLTKHKVVV